MPQPIPNSNNAYLVLHELNESQLNVGEIQISGLCSTCSALGALLTQETTQNKPLIKENKAKELGKELNEINTAINKHLIQQLPLIKKQMQQSLNKMTPRETSSPTNAETAQDQTYVKTVNLLQEKIVQINQQLDIAMKRVLKAVPEAKQNEFEKLLQAATIYQSTLCGTSLMSTEHIRLSIFLSCLKANTEMYINEVSAGPEKTRLLEFSSMIDKITETNKAVFESFKMQTINNLPIMKVFDSANQKHQNIGKQLTEGNFSNADIVLAVAKRHDVESVVKQGLVELQLIHGDYDTLSKEVTEFLEKIQLEDINSLAEELIQSEPVTIPAEPTIIKKTHKARNSAAEQKINPEAASSPNTPDSIKNENVVEKSGATQFNIELAKLADWLHQDLKVLKNSTSEEKRKLGQLIAEQLADVYGQIDADKWPAGKTEVQQYKTDIESRLSTLEQLIGEAMAQNSPPPSPPPSPQVSPQPETRKSPENVGMQKTQFIEQQNSANKNLPAQPPKVTTAQAAAIRHMSEPLTFDGQLQVAIQKLNSARTKMCDAYSKQESFRQTLLESNQPLSIAWANINQVDMVLDYLSQNIVFHAHTAYVMPYVEYRLPMAEMIRCIQAERFHPHFDQRNCQAYLGRASDWLDTLTSHFDYLNQLMSVTESMLTDQQRVA